MDSFDLYDWLWGVAVVSLLSSFACALLWWIVTDTTNDPDDDHPTHI